MSCKNKTCPLFQLKNRTWIDPSKILAMRFSEDCGPQAWYYLTGNVSIAVEHESTEEAVAEMNAVNKARNNHIGKFDINDLNLI